MPFVFSIKDSYRHAVEAATGGKNTVMYDDLGNPSVMVFVPRFNLSDVITGAPNTPHPAFIVNGVVKDGIWISKYQNVIRDGRAYSLPGVVPGHSMTIDTASNASKAKGAGWHLMTNAEWAAIALWCKKNGFMPRGNNNFGKDHAAPHENGRLETPSSPARILTGTGPVSFAHDNTIAGIYDLNGNVNEFVDGLRLVNGKIFVHPDNNFNTPDNLANWLDTGVFYDNSTTGNDTQSAVSAGGSLILNSQRENPMHTGGDTDSSFAENNAAFESLGAKAGYTVPELMKYLALAPTPGDHASDRIYVRNYGTRIPFRGGNWSYSSSAGVFALVLYNPRSHAASALGFRSAFVQ